MNDYVTKPVDPEALVRALERWLTEEKSAEAERLPAEPEVTVASPLLQGDLIPERDNTEYRKSSQCTAR